MFGFQSPVKLICMIIIIFYSIAWSSNMCIFQPCDRTNSFILSMKRQRSRNTIRIVFVHIQSFWFQSYLVTIFICKTINLCFQRHTVTRTVSCNAVFQILIEHRRFIKRGTENIMCLLIGASNPVRNLFWMHRLMTTRAKHSIITCFMTITIFRS